MKSNIRSTALALALAFVAPAFAAPMPAAQHSATKVRATLDFSIVIPETLHIHSGAEKLGHVRMPVSQTTESLADRVVVTIAKP